MKFTLTVFMFFAFAAAFLAFPGGASAQKDGKAAGNVPGPVALAMKPFEYNVIDNDIIDLIDDYSLAGAEKDISVDGSHKTAESDVLRYNLSKTSLPASESWYLNNKILLSSNKSMLESFVPDDYLTADLPSRDKSPLSRFTQGADTGASSDSDIRTKASNALLDVLFSSITGNMLTFNIIPGVKDAVSIQLRPIKNLILKFSASGEQLQNIGNFEIKLLPTEKTNISLKTSDNETETKTGIEFQMMF